jgi:hypothetical protein
MSVSLGGSRVSLHGSRIGFHSSRVFLGVLGDLITAIIAIMKFYAK